MVVRAPAVHCTVVEDRAGVLKRRRNSLQIESRATYRAQPGICKCDSRDPDQLKGYRTEPFHSFPSMSLTRGGCQVLEPLGPVVPVGVAGAQDRLDGVQITYIHDPKTAYISPGDPKTRFLLTVFELTGYADSKQVTALA